MSDAQYERLLERVAASAAYPSTPDLRPRVVAALTPEPSPANVGWPAAAVRPARLAWIAAAAAAVVATALALTLPSSRNAIADFFGIEGSEIELLPTPPPGVTPTPLPPEAPLEDIGTRVSLEDAERLAGFPLSLPSGEAPQDVFMVRYRDEHVAVLRYRQFDLWQARPRDIVFGKGLPDGVIWLELVVRGRPAAWIEGGPHLLSLIDAEGQPLPGSRRIVKANTLVWNSGYAFYRIETPLTRLDALRIAERLP